jgi:hypothetical protein
MALFDASGHCRGHFQGPVCFHKVVIREVQGNRSFKVFKLFTECVRETGKPAAMHPQGVILLLNVRRGNAVNFWHPAHNRLFNFHNLRRAIPNSGGSRRITERGNGVGFYNLPVIRFRAKAALNGIGVSFQRIRRNLDPHCHTGSQVIHERFGVVRVALANDKRRNQLRVCIQGDERPNVAVSPGPLSVLLSGVLVALDMSPGTATKGGGDRISNFVNTKSINPFASNALLEMINEPIKFRASAGMAYGYDATILPELCEAVLKARNSDKGLNHQQLHIAEQAEMLLMAFAKVGIIALVDEATGFQYERPRRDLEDQLKKFLSESLRQWVRTFPTDYFKHLCRLRGVELRSDMKLPQYFGNLTNNLIYRRIAPGLLKRLKDRRMERGSPSNKLTQWLSEDIGTRAILVHLGTVVGLMKIHTDYMKFEWQLNDISPVYPDTPGLFDNPKDWEEPKE